MATVKEKLKELETILKDNNTQMKKNLPDARLRLYIDISCFLIGALTAAIGYCIFICM